MSAEPTTSAAASTPTTKRVRGRGRPFRERIADSLERRLAQALEHGVVVIDLQTGKPALDTAGKPLRRPAPPKLLELAAEVLARPRAPRAGAGQQTNPAPSGPATAPSASPAPGSPRAVPDWLQSAIGVGHGKTATENPK